MTAAVAGITSGTEGHKPNPGRLPEMRWQRPAVHTGRRGPLLALRGHRPGVDPCVELPGARPAPCEAHGGGGCQDRRLQRSAHRGDRSACRRVGFADIDDDLADPKVTYLAQEILFLVRDHGWTPASAFAEWQTRTPSNSTPKPRDPFRNRRPGPCKGCTVQVEASAGWLFSLIIPGVGDSWHLLCERCSTPYLPEA